MAVLQIYDRLLQFPLFQGMSRDDLEIVAGHTRFGFLKVSDGRQIIHAGDPCTHLYFLINGTLKIETYSDDSRYSVTEQMSSPYILQQESVFGYYQRYTHNFYALTDANFLTLDKEEVVRLSEDFLVFRLNLMNHLATQSQKLIQMQWRRSPQSLRERIVRFFFQHTLYPAGPKTFHILMERLAEEVNDSRLNVSRALNRMQEAGVLELHRGRIEIPQLERLLM
ncbi:MAG: Crp/Fnr family transcriptional regulator [Prevotella sp.]|nr:Crp/Fnr family transcriptional regulator [Prevotella sp.]MBR3109936.1 Crp/Fnr family transcriptional regulator [Prevotella sp.]MBR3111577.1 Crp/Fnr family transcriptional regulator [Prevotella sp.]